MSTEFNALRDLAVLIERHFPLRTQVINKKKTDLHSKLYSGLIDDSIGDENQLIESIAISQSERTTFHVLRNQFKEKLFNMLFMLDLSDSESSEYRRAIFENARLVFLTQAMTLFGLTNFAVRLSRRGLKHAEKYELTANKLHFLRVLRFPAAFHGEKTAYLKLEKSVRETLELQVAENKAREKTENLFMNLALTGTGTDLIAKEGIAASHTLKELFNKFPTYNIGIEYYRVSTISLELNYEYAKAAVLCTEALAFFSRFQQLSHRDLFGEFALRKLECSLHTHDYTAAKEAAAECDKYYLKGEPNWFGYRTNDFLLRMHLLEFATARHVLTQVTNQPEFRALPEMRQKPWALYEYYLEYIEGKFKNAEFAKRRLDSLERYRLTTTAYTKDKSGYNVAIIVIEFLILLESRQYGQLAEKIDALRVYKQRYLKKATAQNAFLAFLMQVARNLDNPEALKKAAAKEKASTNREALDPLEGVQVLPYSWLRKHILESLRT